MTQKGIGIRIVPELKLAYGRIVKHLPSAGCKPMTAAASLQLHKLQR